MVMGGAVKGVQGAVGGASAADDDDVASQVEAPLSVFVQFQVRAYTQTPAYFHIIQYSNLVKYV
jgi:hypothetical protein